MAEKKKPTAWLGMLTNGVAMLSEQVISHLFAKLRTETTELFLDIEQKTITLHKKHAQRLFANIILLIAVTFFITALTLALIQQLNITPALTFTIIGALLLITASTLKYFQQTR